MLLFFIIVIIIVLAVGFTLTKGIDKLYDKKAEQEQTQPLTQITTQEKPNEIDLLIAIDKKLAKQNEHLATIRCYVGWLLAIVVIPIILGILGVGGYSVFLSEIFKNL